MDNLKKIASGLLRSGVLTTGLYGLYYFHKRRIPEYMGIISFCITCVGIYAMCAFILEDEFEESEDDKDKEQKSVRGIDEPGTPTPTKRPMRTRRILVREESPRKTDKVLENRTHAKKLVSKGVYVSPEMLKLSKEKSGVVTVQGTSAFVGSDGVLQMIYVTQKNEPDNKETTFAANSAKSETDLCLKEMVNKPEAKKDGSSEKTD